MGLVATILGSSMAFIDGSVVNVALPVLQGNLHATVTDLQWIVVQGVSLFDVCTSRMRRNQVASIVAKMSTKLLPDCHH